MSTRIPAWAKPLFQQPPPIPSRKCWCMFRNGKSHGTPGRTKTDLLIGYDLMPLRGLRQTETSLRKRGINPSRTIIRHATTSREFCLAVNGQFSVGAAVWSVICSGERKAESAGSAFRSSCGWIARGDNEHKKQFTSAELDSLIYVWWTISGKSRWEQRDGRANRKLKRHGTTAVNAMLREGFQISPCEIMEFPR